MPDWFCTRTHTTGRFSNSLSSQLTSCFAKKYSIPTGTEQLNPLVQMSASCQEKLAGDLITIPGDLCYRHQQLVSGQAVRLSIAHYIAHEMELL